MYEILAVYHGGTDEITKPDVTIGRPRLDFGPGFYLTDLYPQAREWAFKIAERRNLQPILNTYHLNHKDMIDNSKGIIFKAYDKDWLDFVTQSRLGQKPWMGLDFVEGGVADDNVVDSIRLYMNGFISAEETLQRLKYFKPSTQICILNQEVLDRYLTFIKSEEL